jgi:hypothetical protein
MFLQVRSKISTFGGFGGPTEVTCGGNALKFYSSVRLNIKRIGFVKKGEEVQFIYHFSSIASYSRIAMPVQIQWFQPELSIVYNSVAIAYSAIALHPRSHQHLLSHFIVHITLF